MIDKIQGPGRISEGPAIPRTRTDETAQKGFGSLLKQQLDARDTGTQPVNFSRHALERAEERGIELTQTLMEKLADSVEKAQEKGATNILAIDDSRAFIINIPYGRVITMMSQEEMKENIFTNIDGAVLL